MQKGFVSIVIALLFLLLSRVFRMSDKVNDDCPKGRVEHERKRTSVKINFLLHALDICEYKNKKKYSQYFATHNLNKMKRNEKFSSLLFLFSSSLQRYLSDDIYVSGECEK